MAKFKVTKKEKKRVIDDAVAHLNGYVMVLEKGHNIPALAVRDTIKDLKELKRKCLK
jgi:hypothetical protein